MDLGHRDRRDERGRRRHAGVDVDVELRLLALLAAVEDDQRTAGLERGRFGEFDLGFGEAFADDRGLAGLFGGCRGPCLELAALADRQALGVQGAVLVDFGFEGLESRRVFAVLGRDFGAEFERDRRQLRLRQRLRLDPAVDFEDQVADHDDRRFGHRGHRADGHRYRGPEGEYPCQTLAHFLVSLLCGLPASAAPSSL